MRFAIVTGIGVLLAQTPQRIQLWDFNSGIQGWTLNAGSLHNSPSNGNRWVRGTPYASVLIDPATIGISSCQCQGVSSGYSAPAAPNQPSAITGSPQSAFLYISYNPTAFGCGGNQEPFTYIGALTLGFGGDCLGAETYFCYSPPVTIPSSVSTPVHLRFYWTGEAHSSLSGGRIYYRVGSGAWQQVGTTLRGQTSWQQVDLVLPGVTGGQSVEVGFEFFNNSGIHTTTVVTSLGIDEVELYYEATNPPPSTLTLGTITPSTVCAGGTLNVPYTSGLSGNPTYTAQVFDGSGTIVASASGASPIAVTIPNIVPSGTYSVRVVANTNPPTYSDTASITIVNVQSLSCSATPSPTLPGSVVTLTLNGTGLPSGPFTVQLNPGDGSPTQTQNNVNSLPVSFTHTYSSSGSYTATFTITHTASGCTGTCNATVQIGGERIDALALRDSVVCADDSFYVDYSSVGITFAAGNTFTVEVRDGSGNVITSCATNSNAPSGSLGCRIPVGTAPGTYSVRIRSSNPVHISNSLFLTVSNPPTADFEPNTNLRFCAGEPITFTDRSQNATRVQWDFGDGTISTNRNPTHTYTQPGTYTVTLTASIGTSCTASIQRDIEVRPAPQASFTVNPPSLTLPEQNTATFTNTSTGASSYQWDFGNGQTSTAENPTATYDQEGEYLVVLTAISPEGCRDTAQYKLQVVFAQGLSIPNAFTPNGDGMNDRYAVRYSGMQTLRVSIYDRWGNLIFTDQRNTPTGTIEWDGTKNGQPAPEGVYAVYLEGKTVDGRDIRRSVAITLLR